MRQNIIIAAVAAIAAFAASTETANAQQSTVNNLVEKATVWKLSEGQTAKSDAISAASVKTNIFDDVKLQMAAPIANSTDSLMMEWREQMRRTATYGWGIGITAGGIKMAENFSPTVGIETTYAGKRIMVGAGAELAISKYNNESTKANKSFIAPIFSAKAGVVLTRFKLNGYNNQGYVAVGYEFKYILDKNENLAYENTTTEGNVTTTETQYFAVEGNSMCHCGFVEARFGLKHMGTTSIGVKAYGGVYNRYYIEGSRRKAMVGVSVSLYFSGAKKTTDKDVKALRTSLENGNYELANEVINNLRANMK
jgi:hypothetical protein